MGVGVQPMRSADPGPGLHGRLGGRPGGVSDRQQGFGVVALEWEDRNAGRDGGPDSDQRRRSPQPGRKPDVEASGYQVSLVGVPTREYTDELIAAVAGRHVLGAKAVPQTLREHLD